MGFMCDRKQSASEPLAEALSRMQPRFAWRASILEQASVANVARWLAPGSPVARASRRSVSACKAEVRRRPKNLSLGPAAMDDAGANLTAATTGLVCDISRLARELLAEAQ
mmetsp:Transcript_104758/g.295140  ORF Transcript_104758/g.295140 Transcript_104758/m.295140 type:complete len:111 (+) Transcript_104758:602-934(+)